MKFVFEKQRNGDAGDASAGGHHHGTPLGDQLKVHAGGTLHVDKTLEQTPRMEHQVEEGTPGEIAAFAVTGGDDGIDEVCGATEGWGHLVGAAVDHGVLMIKHMSGCQRWVFESYHHHVPRRALPNVSIHGCKQRYPVMRWVTHG